MLIKKEIKKIIEKEILIKKTEKNNFFFVENGGYWIFDFRVGFAKASVLSTLSKYFWNKYEKYFPFQVGGLESGAIQFISGIAMEGINRGKDINTFFVRKTRKDTGLGNKIEGKLNKEKIIIVDDLYNKGGSILKVVDSLGENKKNIFKTFVFVNFGSEEGRNNIMNNNLDIDYEFTLSDFGLDIFGNGNLAGDDREYHPLIFPNKEFLGHIENSNRFLVVPKSNIIKDGKYIYFGGEGGRFIKLCSETGLEKASFVLDKVIGHKNILGNPIIHKNHIFFGSYDGNFYSLNKKNLSLNWKNINADWIGSSSCISEKHKLIYVGLEYGSSSYKGALCAMDLDNGNTIWQFFFDDYVHCSPEYSEKIGIVICGSNDGKLVCVRGDSGKILFERQFLGAIKSGFVFSSDHKTFYFGGFDNKFYAINTISGNIKWSFETGNIIFSKSLLLGNNIFFGSTDKNFYHLDINGKLVKKILTLGKIFSKPVFIKKSVIAFSSYDGFICFYDFKTKKVIFKINHIERISTNLFFDEKFGHLYVLDFLNQLFKYDVGKYL